VHSPTAVLFDNDGLLLDTESAWSRAEQELFERRDREFTIEHKRSLIGSSDRAAGIKLARFLEEPGNEAAIMSELHEIVYAELESGVDPMVGALELLASIRAAGIPVGLVSNSPMRFILRSHEVADTGLPFDVVISAHEVAEAKPAPDPYLEACRRLGVPPGPDAVALEDSPSGVSAAVAAGLFTIGIPSVPGIVLDRADLVASTLEDPAVLVRLGIEPATRPTGP
jgi:HAD superfamily hydrolase (TIGR01509 family)